MLLGLGSRRIGALDDTRAAAGGETAGINVFIRCEEVEDAAGGITGAPRDSSFSLEIKPGWSGCRSHSSDDMVMTPSSSSKEKTPLLAWTTSFALSKTTSVSVLRRFASGSSRNDPPAAPFRGDASLELPFFRSSAPFAGVLCNTSSSESGISTTLMSKRDAGGFNGRLRRAGAAPGGTPGATTPTS